MIPKPYLVFLGDVTEPTYTKTGFGLRDWAPEHIVGEWSLPQAKVSLGLVRLSPKDAAAAGAQAMVLGIATVGGKIPQSYVQTMVDALACGLDIVSGLHTRLSSIPELVEAAKVYGRRLHDVRQPPHAYPVGDGLKRKGLRLLTVGTDCALGKKYTAMTLARALCQRGIDADFRATGQTGIMISGQGVPLDAVVADFISGAVEYLTPEAGPLHWDIIEGQGSLFHPGFAGVTVGLVHGAQADAMILCHDPRRETIYGLPHIKIPPLSEVMRRYIELAQLTNPKTRFVGISLNTSDYPEPDALRMIKSLEAEHAMPVTDPIRYGVEDIVDLLEAEFTVAA
jgi:uncharacterized NAD-dependent epimerase/dehydratase family protein